jgi:hypothetical protein
MQGIGIIEQVTWKRQHDCDIDQISQQPGVRIN